VRTAIFLAMLLATLPWTVSAADQTAAPGTTYREDVPKIAGMQPKWFFCNTSSDCGLFRITCGWLLAANIHYLQQAQNVYCAQEYGCNSSACARPNIVVAVCEKSQCVTKDTSQPVK
jgi:hypothetical protein